MLSHPAVFNASCQLRDAEVGQVDVDDHNRVGWSPSTIRSLLQLLACDGGAFSAGHLKCRRSEKSTAAVAPVPEPSALSLLVIAATISVVCRQPWRDLPADDCFPYSCFHTKRTDDHPNQRKVHLDNSPFYKTTAIVLSSCRVACRDLGVGSLGVRWYRSHRLRPMDRKKGMGCRAVVAPRIAELETRRTGPQLGRGTAVGQRADGSNDRR